MNEFFSFDYLRLKYADIWEKFLTFAGVMDTDYGKIYWWILAIAALLFIPFLGGVHLFDWDEINFAEIAREMMITGDYLHPKINFEPFWEKPPFFIWLQVLSMKAFGVNEFAARLPNALIGLLTLGTIMRLGDRLSNTPNMGKYWAMAHLGAFLPHLYFRSGIIDPLFNYFMLLGIIFYGIGYVKSRGIGRFPYPEWLYVLLSGVFIGLGILTKGPVAYLIPVLVIVIEWMVRRMTLTRTLVRHWALLTLGTLITTMLWFGPDILQNGGRFTHQFIDYQIRLFSTPDSGHGGFFGYHVLVLLVGVFPASFLAIRGLIFRREIRKKNDTLVFNRLMSVTFWVVLVLFTIVKTKIVHYSSMAYFPLTYYTGMAVAKWQSDKTEIPQPPKKWLLLVGILLGVSVMALPFAGRHTEWIKQFFENDAFAQANLNAQVDWPWWTVLPGIWLVLVVLVWHHIQKKHRKYTFEVLFFGIAVFMWLGLTLFTGRIEAYTQRAAIEFFESKQDEDCYILPVGYKTYAHYFYGRLTPDRCIPREEQDRLLHGQPDKPVYLITKQGHGDFLRKLRGAKEIGRKNGFIIFKREADQ